jgi:hypothetical protein
MTGISHESVDIACFDTNSNNLINRGHYRGGHLHWPNKAPFRQQITEFIAEKVVIV